MSFVLPCAERDRLWADYCAALDRYILDVKALVLATVASSRDAATGLREARVVLDHHRFKIRDHALEHGCDSISRDLGRDAADAAIAGS